MTPEELIDKLRPYKFDLTNEKRLQLEIWKILGDTIHIVPEYRLDKGSVIDFLLPTLSIGLEVKIKGSSTSIYRQCIKYCEYDEIQSLILITNKSMGLPETINGKKCYLMSLGKAWL